MKLKFKFSLNLCSMSKAGIQITISIDRLSNWPYIELTVYRQPPLISSCDFKDEDMIRNVT